MGREKCIHRLIYVIISPFIANIGTWTPKTNILRRALKPIENQPWIFIGRTDAEAEALILWPSDVKSQLSGKDPDAGKYWGQEEKETENEMVGWHHWLKEHEFE